MKNLKFSILTVSLFAAASLLSAQDHTTVYDDGSIGISSRDSDGNYNYTHISAPPTPSTSASKPATPPANGTAQSGSPQAGAPDAQNGGRPGGPGGRRFGRPGEDRNLARVNVDAKMQGPFFFVDESPQQVVQALESLIGKNILMAQGLPAAKINFITKRQMTKDDAISALTSLLALNGIAIAPLNDKLYRAIPTIGIGRQSPEFLKGDISDLPPSQAFCTKLFELEYIEVTSVQNKIKNLMSADGTGLIESFPRSNALLITDTLINLQNINSLLKRLDVAAIPNEEIVFIPVKNVGASDIRDKLNNLQNDLLRKYFEKTSIDFDSRTNQLIVVTQKGNLDHIKKIVDALDVQAEPMLKNEVIFVRHCEASEIETVLKSIITQQQQQLARAAKERRDTASAAARDAAVRANAIRQVSQPNSVSSSAIKMALPASGGDSAMSGLEFSEYVQVVSHKTSSSIVVYGTDTDIKQLKRIVERLDVAIDQVKIDVIITEVNLSDGQVSGLSSFGLSYNMPQPDNGIRDTGVMGLENKFAMTTSSQGVDETSPSAFSFGINEKAFQAAFNIARQNQDVKVLSAPMVVTTHAKKAQISVTEDHPTITSTLTDTSNASTSRSQYSKEKIGITLDVTPYVGTDNVIRLDIQQQVQSIVRYAILDNNSLPVVSTRRIESTVSVLHDNVIVLGGLQQTDMTDKEGEVWLLGDIPLLGNLFKPSQSSSKRRELIMFIRPTIIRSASVEQTLESGILKDSFVEREVRNFLLKKQFYTEDEIKTNEKQFEDNRAYNKIFKDPVAFLKNEKTILEGSTKALNEQELAAKEKAAEAEIYRRPDEKQSDEQAAPKTETPAPAEQGAPSANAAEEKNKGLVLRRRK